MEAAESVAPEVGVSRACRTLGVARATLYRHRRPPEPPRIVQVCHPPSSRPVQPPALRIIDRNEPGCGAHYPLVDPGGYASTPTATPPTKGPAGR